jgi:hypothetical protein
MNISLIVEILTGVAVLAGLIFAAYEVNQFRQDRHRDSAIRLFETFQRPDIVKGIRLVFNLPERDFSFEELEEHFGDDMEYVNSLAHVIEGLGVLVKNRELSLELVEEYFGGPIVLYWSRLGWYEQEIRERSGRSTYAEFLEWLADRLIEQESESEVIPAFIEYADWKE